MAQHDDKLTEMEGNLVRVTTAVQGIGGDLQGLAAEIQALKDQIANGGVVTPEFLTRFSAVGDGVKNAADSLEAMDAQNPPPAP